jgi:hypothetical protein
VGGGNDVVDPLPQIVSTSSGFSATSAGVQPGVQAVLTSPINGKLLCTSEMGGEPLFSI